MLVVSMFIICDAFCIGLRMSSMFFERRVLLSSADAFGPGRQSGLKRQRIPLPQPVGRKPGLHKPGAKRWLFGRCYPPSCTRPYPHVIRFIEFRSFPQHRDAALHVGL